MGLRGEVGEVAVMDSVNHTQFRQGDERRQFRRFPMALPVLARRDELAGGQELAEAARPERTVNIEVQDFSLGGIRGSSPVALRRGEALTVSVPPFGTRPEVDVTGRVARCQRLGGRFDVGIEFCQTREAPESSPWLRIHELFYLAGESRKTIQ